jgi:hypothetical protein
MTTSGELKRVLADLTHGGHALVDVDPDAKKALLEPGTEVALSEVVQESAEVAQLVGTTSFDYLFRDLADRFPDEHLPGGAKAPQVVSALKALGAAMIDQPEDDPEHNSPIPPIYTYFGQFVDHDITANTDRERDIQITVDPLVPLPPVDVTAHLHNLRNPALNLDSVYGDGPFVNKPSADDEAVPYDGIKLRLGQLFPVSIGVRIPPIDDMNRDLPRRHDETDATLNGKALTGDGRNDENLVVAQLHVAFLRFHNAAVDWVRANEPERESDAEVFLRARDLTRWTYQWLVVHDYLRTVTAQGVVDSVLTDDDNLLRLDERGVYMPIEFSVAAFRFGHSMVRARYDWNRNFGRPGNNGKSFATFDQLFQFTGKSVPPFGFNLPNLPSNWPAEWARMVDKNSLEPDRFARRIDTRLAPPLHQLRNEGAGDPADPINKMLKELAIRNLLRGYRLALPTGQAVAAALGVPVLTRADLETNSTDEIKAALEQGEFFDRTPLWFYVLKEAEVRASGNSLGEVGSRIVAATIIGQIRKDRGSYLNQTSWGPAQGVRLPDGRPVRSIADFLRFAGVL